MTLHGAADTAIGSLIKFQLLDKKVAFSWLDVSEHALLLSTA